MTDRLAKSACVFVVPPFPRKEVRSAPPSKAHDDCRCVFDHHQGCCVCCFGLGGLGGPQAVLGVWGVLAGLAEWSLGVLGGP